MRRPRWSTLLVLAVVSGAGLATGQLLARAGAERFDVNAWPRRGAGPRLVEYFDPRCAASRAVHLRLAAELGDAPWVEHVLVPVALSRGVKPAPADRLCALGGDAAFTTALAWALQGGPPAAATDGEPDARTRACAATGNAHSVDALAHRRPNKTLTREIPIDSYDASEDDNADFSLPTTRKARASYGRKCHRWWILICAEPRYLGPRCSRPLNVGPESETAFGVPGTA